MPSFDRVRFNRLATALLMGALVVGNAPIEAPAADRNQIVAKGRTILEDTLVDYSRARFRSFHVVRFTSDSATAKWAHIKAGVNVVALCGEVNSPNRMGGYTGWGKMAVIVEGRGFDQVIAERQDISGYYEICPGTNVGPKNAELDPIDVSALLAPGASPGASGGFS